MSVISVGILLVSQAKVAHTSRSLEDQGHKFYFCVFVAFHKKKTTVQIVKRSVTGTFVVELEKRFPFAPLIFVFLLSNNFSVVVIIFTYNNYDTVNIECSLKAKYVSCLQYE